MGKSELAAASIGIKILLSDVLSQLDETNFGLVVEMLQSGIIEDENDYYNELFQTITIDNDKKMKGSYLDVKDYLTGEFEKENLMDKYLLIPIKKILRTERWGYERNGTNGSSRPIDFDLSVSVEKYKEIEKFEIVFILLQIAG